MDILKKNEIYEALIDGYSSEAYGVCHINGRAVFVPRAIPGEVWQIKIVKVSNTAVYAIGVELLSPSSERVESLCPHFGKCGGCDTWHMTYAEELNFKRRRVDDALARIGKQTVLTSSIIGADTCTRYRNKAIFAVSDIEGAPTAGFYRERSHSIIPVSDCLIQNELSSRVSSAVVSFMAENNMEAYNEETGRGLVRHVFTRKAVHTDDAVACIVATGGFGEKTNALVSALRSACPELTGIVLNVNKTRGNTVLAGKFYTLWGKADIRDSLCGLYFNISPQAFYQINPVQAEKLYNKAIEYALPSPDALALDMYCGAGTISLCLARHAKKVIGAEIVPQAIENAAQNAQQNGIDNVEFICADASDAAQQFLARGIKPDVIVVDPPRKGMDERAIEALAAMGAERIVYVSCNPATLARDILRFNSNGYILRDVTAVDMFPRTRHIECVALLNREEHD